MPDVRHDDIHITRFLLRAVRTGEATPLAVYDTLQAHLADLCPQCRSEIDRFEEQDLGGRGPLLRSTLRKLRSIVPQMERETADARARVADLRGVPAAELPDAARRLPTEAVGPILVEELLARAVDGWADEPERSLAWAQAALEALDRDPGAQAEQRVRALAYCANAHRLLGDSRAARRWIAEARRRAAEDAVVDPDVQGELDSLEGSLCTDLRLLDRAEELLVRATALFRSIGDGDSAARALIKLGNLHTARSDPHAAVEARYAALEQLGSAPDPKLYLTARFNLAHDLLDTGRHLAARDLLTYDEDLYGRYADAHTELRVAWLEGRIARDTGAPETAERLLCHVLEGLVARRDGFDAALVSLDLAQLYRRQGRFTELRDLVVRAAALFRAEEVHRDALAALLMLRDAAAQEAVTAAAIERAADRVRAALRAPRPD